MVMARVQTIVQLTTALVAKLDKAAKKRGQSRSAAIRDAIETWLRKLEDEEIGRQIAEGYKRFPPPTIDEWGNLEEQMVAGTHRAMREMEAEERQAGFPPW